MVTVGETLQIMMGFGIYTLTLIAVIISIIKINHKK